MMRVESQPTTEWISLHTVKVSY